ncbi:MAG: tetratricopeptide repeat protein [Treponema sp.]|jgi:tetratricopeptide (TPR) repeat protein|nr:tetratricopeptide repeat protein [Treponema sp.]
MRVLVLLFLLAAGLGLWAENLPAWLIPLREAVYEQTLTADEVRPLYLAAKAAAAQNYSGPALDMALSRCEYFMGRVLHREERNDEARVHYLEGINFAEKTLAAAPGADAWVMLAENLSQACAVSPWTYMIANGLNIEKFAKNALSFNSRNAAAQYLIAARWVFAPAPLHNHRKGIQMMEAILPEGDMEKDDRFNIYSAIGYAYVQQKRYAEARPWILRSLEIYPTNKYANDLLNKR